MYVQIVKEDNDAAIRSAYADGEQEHVGIFLAARQLVDVRYHMFQLFAQLVVHYPQRFTLSALLFIQLQ
jgi:hypothetical protein